jgi:hypothetical protein
MTQRAEERGLFRLFYINRRGTMSIQEALDTLDEKKPNTMSPRLKMKALTVIEQLVHDEIVMRHEHTPEQEAKPVYTEDSDPQTELVIPDPYSEIYVDWLMCEVDRQNQEDARYNVDRALFDNSWGTMSDWYTRNHIPTQAAREFRA